MIHDDDPLDLSIEELPTSAWAVQAPEGNSAVIRRSYKVSIYDKDYSPRGFEYFEAAEGKLIDCKLTNKEGVKGRYVRCYSKGSTADDQNHYTEVEVYGVQK